MQDVDEASPTGAAVTGIVSTGDGTARVGAGIASLVGAAAGTVAEGMPAGIDVENEDTVLKSTELGLCEPLGPGATISVVVGSVLLPLGKGGLIAVVVGSVALPVGTGELTAVVAGSVLFPADVAVVPGGLALGLPAGHVKPPIEPLLASRDGVAVSAEALCIS